MDIEPGDVLGQLADKKPTEIDFARARRLWKQSRPYGKPWDSLPRSQQIFGALPSRLMEDDTQ